MELKEFVSQTISQIIEGVNEAGEMAKNHGATVNPHIVSSASEMGKQGMLWGGGQPIQIIKFDVALTVTQGTGTKGGIGIVTGVVSLGSTGESQSANTSVSRVQFSVPIALPVPKDTQST